MIKRLIAGYKKFRRLDKPGRFLKVFPDDVFIVSYPKSGNTWTRFLIANLVYPEKHPDFSNINWLVPDPEGLSRRDLARLPRPRYLKSHAYFDHRYPKVIHIVRDPRDVVLSEYYFDIKREAIPEDFPKDKFVSRFVSGELNHPYGTWGENTATWYYARGNTSRLLLVTYESLQSDGPHQMARIAGFLGIHTTPEKIAYAIEQSSADRMRELEKKQGHLWSSTKRTRQDKPFVRAAKAGGWKKELSAASIEEIETKWGRIMQELGYELVSGNGGTGDSPVQAGTSEQYAGTR
ncbi:MAG TPA: sulfotransferase domain-containing protein [Terriglobales bacterium]|nr:sulfotransferase domain-containing protein [Terriglobales bacterium]